MENTRHTNPASRGKKLFAALLAAVMVLGLFPSSALAGPSDPVGVNNYVATLVADPDTSAAPGDFGTSAADGRVWTDKSVKVGVDDFEVTLSALAQEYRRTKTTTTTTQVAADVALVLDMSASMNTGGRVQLMANGVNQAIDTIMKANPENRVGVYYFSTPGSVGTVLELASYRAYNKAHTTEITGTPGTNDRYITYVDSTHIAPGPKNSTSSVQKTVFGSGSTWMEGQGASIVTDSGTTTQRGLYLGVNALISDPIIESINTAVGKERYPYVLLFTDGGANFATDTWYDNVMTSATNPNAAGVSGDVRCSALTILTAAKLKQELKEAYAAYNGKTKDPVWFNIGFGISESGNTYANALLDPSKVVSGATGQYLEVYNRINTEIGNLSGGNTQYSKYGTAGDPGHMFAKYIYYADSEATLNAAFSKLSSLIKEATQEKVLPVDVVTTSGQAATGAVFTDVLGENMALKGAPTLGSVQGTGTTAGAETTYAFANSESTAVYNSDTNTLTWSIAASELPLYKIDEPSNPNSTYTAANPVRLTYNVCMAAGYDDGNALFSNALGETVNALAEAVFTPTVDNPYYYTVTLDGEGGFVSSTPKAAGASIAKTPGNDTGTAAYSQAFAFTDGQFTTTLGNNGKLTPMLNITKSASPDSAFRGEQNITVTFTVVVRNFTGETIYNVVVGDTLPAALALDEGSLTVNGTPSIAFDSSDSGSFTYTIASIPANTSVTLTYGAALNTASSGTYTNEATIKSVTPEELGNPQAVTPEAETEISVLVGETYPAEVDVTLDDDPYTDRTVGLYKDGTLKYTLTEGGNGVYTDDSVLEGIYDIYVDGVNTGKTLVVSAQGENQAQVDYYTVTFYDGSNQYSDPAQQIVLSGDTATQPDDPEKSDFTFDAWLDADDDAFDFDTAITGTTNIYASWTQATPNDHTITATADSGGDITNPGAVTVAPGGNRNYTITPAPGYRVKDVLVDGVSVGAVTSYIFSDVNADHTIHVVFEPILIVVKPDITVTFDSQGGTPVSPITTAPRSRIDPPVSPTRPGYIFTGWYKDPACTTPWDFTQRVNYSTTLYAGWIASAAVSVPKTGGGDTWLGFAMAACALLLAGAVPFAARKRKKER